MLFRILASTCAGWFSLALATCFIGIATVGNDHLQNILRGLLAVFATLLVGNALLLMVLVIWEWD